MGHWEFSQFSAILVVLTMTGPGHFSDSGTNPTTEKTNHESKFSVDRRSCPLCPTVSALASRAGNFDWDRIRNGKRRRWRTVSEQFASSAEASPASIMARGIAPWEVAGMPGGGRDTDAARGGR
jgi:hypothetical protein